MNNKDAQKLGSVLDTFLSSTFTSASTIELWPLYTYMRDMLRAGNIEGLQDNLEKRINEEKLFGKTETKNMAIYDILFGDISKVPPLISAFPELCEWRFAIVEEASGA